MNPYAQFKMPTTPPKPLNEQSDQMQANPMLLLVLD